MWMYIPECETVLLLTRKKLKVVSLKVWLRWWRRFGQNLIMCRMVCVLPWTVIMSGYGKLRWSQRLPIVTENHQWRIFSSIIMSEKDTALWHFITVKLTKLKSLLVSEWMVIHHDDLQTLCRLMPGISMMFIMPIMACKQLEKFATCHG